jgi:hypothetical protein
VHLAALAALREIALERLTHGAEVVNVAEVGEAEEPGDEEDVVHAR